MNLGQCQLDGCRDLAAGALVVGDRRYLFCEADWLMWCQQMRVGAEDPMAPAAIGGLSWEPFPPDPVRNPIYRRLAAMAAGAFG